MRACTKMYCKQSYDVWLLLWWQAVMVHQLSKKVTQNPFRKNKGRVVAVLFHPKNPLFFVASANHVRVYNLVRRHP